LSLRSSILYCDHDFPATGDQNQIIPSRVESNPLVKPDATIVSQFCGQPKGHP